MAGVHKGLHGLRELTGWAQRLAGAHRSSQGGAQRLAGEHRGAQRLAGSLMLSGRGKACNFGIPRISKLIIFGIL